MAHRAMLPLLSTLAKVPKKVHGALTGDSGDANTKKPSDPTPSPLLAFFTDPGAHYPIYSNICLYLDNADIMDVRRVKELSSVYDHVLKCQLNVNSYLSKFFSNAREFRKIQGLTNAIIAGRSALLFFDRIRSPDDITLEIAVKRGVEAETLVNYVKDAGYVINGAEMYPVQTIEGNLKRVDYVRPSDRYRQKTELKIYVANSSSLSGFMNNVPMTHLANFISWNTAFCLFPAETFIYRETYLLQPPDTQILKRATANGFKTMIRRWDSCPRSNGSGYRRDLFDPYKGRMISDSQSWIIDLETDGVEGPDASDEYPFEIGSFSLMSRNTGNANSVDPTTSYQEIRFKSIRSPVLKHVYITIETDGQRWMKQELQGLTILELLKLDEKERPSLYDSVVATPINANQLIGNFDAPSTWTWYDVDVQNTLRTVGLPSYEPRW